jgi:putative ribosome biogenesis GTPase RsgA
VLFSNEFGRELTSAWGDENPNIFQIVSIIGPEGTGKSALANNLFPQSNFETRKTNGTGQTTKGINAAIFPSQGIILLDVEGSGST